MKALIQKIKGEFPNLNFFQADKGFKELGYEIEYFHYDTVFKNPFVTTDKVIKCIKLNPEDVVVGGIPVIDKALEILGVKNPFLSCCPSNLKDFLGRDVGVRSLADIRQNFVEDSLPIFIKPLDAKRKLFNGHLVSKINDLTLTSGLDQETIVYYSEGIKFVSEYRVFVHDELIVGMKHYKGDYLIYPNPSVIHAMVEEFIDAPIAYALDVGIVEEDTGKQFTYLVEVNDAICLGCYGLNPAKYAAMLSDRWEEATESVPNNVVCMQGN